jgi:hypothetical protein
MMYLIVPLSYEYSASSNLTLRFSGERLHSTFAWPFNNSRAQPSPLQALVRRRFAIPEDILVPKRSERLG